VKIAYRTNRDIDTKQCLSDLLTAPSGYPVQGGEISQHSGESGPKTGPGLGRDVCPSSSSTRALHAPQLVLRDQGFDFWNISNLATKIVTENATGPRFNGSVAGFTQLREYLFDMINLFHGNQLSSCPLVSWLSPRIAFPGFLRPMGFGFLHRAIRRRRLGGIGRIFGQQSDLPFKLIDPGTQTEKCLDDHLWITVGNSDGFFPCHRGSPNLIFISCQ